MAETSKKRNRETSRADGQPPTADRHLSPATCHLSPRPSLTLIEVLAVIVIVSLVAGVATMGLASTTDSARLRAAAAQWRDLDGRARLFGRTLGPVVMSLNADRNEVRLHVSESGELLTKVVLPTDVTGRIVTPSSTHGIAFDRLGHSLDYELELNGGNRIVGWQVYGLTGLVKEQQR